jgi:hypothetical protein
MRWSSRHSATPRLPVEELLFLHQASLTQLSTFVDYIHRIHHIHRIAFISFAQVIDGTVLGGKDLRITGIDGYQLNLPPRSNMLVFNNHDKPGVLR